MARRRRGRGDASERRGREHRCASVGERRKMRRAASCAGPRAPEGVRIGVTSTTKTRRRTNKNTRVCRAHCDRATFEESRGRTPRARADHGCELKSTDYARPLRARHLVGLCSTVVSSSGRPTRRRFMSLHPPIKLTIWRTAASPAPDTWRRRRVDTPPKTLSRLSAPSATSTSPRARTPPPPRRRCPWALRGFP